MRAAWLKLPRLLRLLSLQAIPAVPPPCAAVPPWRAVRSCGAPAAGCARMSCSPDWELCPSPSSPGRSSRDAPAAAAQAWRPQPGHHPGPLHQLRAHSYSMPGSRYLRRPAPRHRARHCGPRARRHRLARQAHRRAAPQQHERAAARPRLLDQHPAPPVRLRDYQESHVRVCAWGMRSKDWLAAACHGRTPTWRRRAALLERSKRCFQRLQPDDDLRAGTGPPSCCRLGVAAHAKPMDTHLVTLGPAATRLLRSSLLDRRLVPLLRLCAVLGSPSALPLRAPRAQCGLVRGLVRSRALEGARCEQRRPAPRPVPAPVLQPSASSRTTPALRPLQARAGFESPRRAPWAAPPSNRGGCVPSGGKHATNNCQACQSHLEEHGRLSMRSAEACPGNGSRHAPVD